MTDPQNDKPKTFARKPDARWEDFFRADGVPLSEAPTYTIVPPSAQMIPWPGRNARRHLHFGMEATTVREAELAVAAIVRRWHWIEPTNRFVLAPQAVIDALADFSWEEPQFTESHGWGSVVMRPLAEFALQMIPSDDLTPAGRLVTALREIAPQIEDVTQDGESVVSIGCLTIEIDDDGCWSINGHEDDGVTIARAAAAVVDHAGTIASLAAERDTLAAEVKRLTERLEVFAGALLSLGAS